MTLTGVAPGADCQGRQYGLPHQVSLVLLGEAVRGNTPSVCATSFDVLEPPCSANVLELPLVIDLPGSAFLRGHLMGTLIPLSRRVLLRGVFYTK